MDKPEVVEFTGGKFILGETKQEVEVKLFAMAKYPVTNQEYEKFDPHHKRCDVSNQNNQPVVIVSWDDAVKYCQWLSEKMDEHYRLPTEAEWEFAVSGGGQRQYPWGNDEPSPEHCNYYGSNIGKTTPVRSYPFGKTPDGLFNMAGNVWEWCNDWYNKRHINRVVRGGSFLDIQVYLRCVARVWFNPHYWFYYVGFRVVRDLSSP